VSERPVVWSLLGIALANSGLRDEWSAMSAELASSTLQALAPERNESQLRRESVAELFDRWLDSGNASLCARRHRH
jgi:hypothetical protein